MAPQPPRARRDRAAGPPARPGHAAVVQRMVHQGMRPHHATRSDGHAVQHGRVRADPYIVADANPALAFKALLNNRPGHVVIPVGAAGRDVHIRRNQHLAPDLQPAVGRQQAVRPDVAARPDRQPPVAGPQNRVARDQHPVAQLDRSLRPPRIQHHVVINRHVPAQADVRRPPDRHIPPDNQPPPAPAQQARIQLAPQPQPRRPRPPGQRTRHQLVAQQGPEALPPHRQPRVLPPRRFAGDMQVLLDLLLDFSVLVHHHVIPPAHYAASPPRPASPAFAPWLVVVGWWLVVSGRWPDLQPAAFRHPELACLAGALREGGSRDLCPVPPPSHQPPTGLPCGSIRSAPKTDTDTRGWLFPSGISMHKPNLDLKQQIT